MNPFLRYLADKHSAHRHTDRHTQMTTRPCGLRRAYGIQTADVWRVRMFIGVIGAVGKAVTFQIVNDAPFAT